MPKINDKVFCVNHPDEEMDEFDNILVSCTKKGDDGKYYQDTNAIIGVAFVCATCKYIELYAFTDAQDALAERHDHTQETTGG